MKLANVKTVMVAPGKVVTVTAKPASNEYAFVGATSDDVNIEGNTFTMPNSEVTVTVVLKQIIHPIVSMGGWTYGQTENQPSVTNNTGSGTVT